MMRFRFLYLLSCLGFTTAALAQESEITISPALFGVFSTNAPWQLRDDNPLPIFDMPILIDRFYAEVRYNYDQPDTFAIYAGREFSLDAKSEHLLTPQAGLLIGDYPGYSLQLYYEFIHKDIEVTFQNQYTISGNGQLNFYYNWTDVQLPVTEKFWLGSSVQLYCDTADAIFDLGAYAGYKSGGWTIFAYSFNFYDLPKHYLLFGIEKEITF